MDYKNFLIDAAYKLNVDITREKAQDFIDYMELLLQWNEKINLTAITDKKEIVLKHFVDSLSVLKVIEKNAKIIDVGTGAGFPGLPVKIAYENVQLTLMDSLNKRILFLNEVINLLGLENVVTVHSRAEYGGKSLVYREKFDYALSRAVANLSILAEYCLPFVKVGGKFISMKGPDVKNECIMAKDIIHTLGGEISDVFSVKIPFTDITHSLIIISKFYKTSLEYPRKPGKIPKIPTV